MILHDGPGETHGSWVTWVMGQELNGSLGSWVTLSNPFPALGWREGEGCRGEEGRERGREGRERNRGGREGR